MEHLKSKNQDWHRAEILARLKMRETSLSEVSRNAGLNSRTLNNVFYRAYPKGQKIIAQAIGIPAELIWPTRYKKAA